MINYFVDDNSMYMNREIEEAIFTLIKSVDDELDMVRKKHNITGNNFSCPYFVKMAEANDLLKKMLKERILLELQKDKKKDSLTEITDVLTEITGMTKDERKLLG